jgi:hypothetical protein
VAEERASLHNFGLACGQAGRIVLRCCREGGVEPVGAPLPYVAGDGVKAEGVGWEAVDGTCAGEAIFGSVDARELALPDVAEVLAVRGKIIAPGIELLLEAAASGVLPLGLGREGFPCPFGVSGGIVPGDVDDGVIGAVVDVGAGTFGVLPGGAGDLTPPRCGGNGVFDEFFETIGWDVRPEDKGPLIDLGLGAVVGGGDESGEVAVGDRVGINGEGGEGDGSLQERRRGNRCP